MADLPECNLRFGLTRALDQRWIPDFNFDVFYDHLKGLIEGKLVQDKDDLECLQELEMMNAPQPEGYDVDTSNDGIRQMLDSWGAPPGLSNQLQGKVKDGQPGLSGWL